MPLTRMAILKQRISTLCLAMLCVGAAAMAQAHALPAHDVSFAVVGDYGTGSRGEADVAQSVHAFDPDFIITTGDNNYPDGDPDSLDDNVGRYYSGFLHPYTGRFGAGASANRFFPALGNHDWENDDLSAYVRFFNVPGNGRYYEIERGPVHLFCLDSDAREPDGITADGLQGQWLKERLAASTASWKVVYMHHPTFGSTKKKLKDSMRWPFAEWGASMVISGHKHFYERLEEDNVSYIINGLGGAEIAKFGKPDKRSVVRFNDDFGYLQVHANRATLKARFVTVSGKEVDAFELQRGP